MQINFNKEIFKVKISVVRSWILDWVLTISNIRAKDFTARDAESAKKNKNFFRIFNHRAHRTHRKEKTIFELSTTKITTKDSTARDAKSAKKNKNFFRIFNHRAHRNHREERFLFKEL